MISLDFPYFLFQSIAKMADKVQLKSKGCDTSLFHHALIKLIVYMSSKGSTKIGIRFCLYVTLEQKNKVKTLALGLKELHQ